MTIDELTEKVASLHLEEAIPALAKQTSSEIILLNQLQLYTRGEDSLGNKNHPYKSKYYADKKNAMNPQPGYGVPDGKLTGEFYRDFHVEVKAKTYEVDSKDEKSGRLKELYGDQIFGMNKENTTTYSLGVFYSAFQRYVTNKTGLIFK